MPNLTFRFSENEADLLDELAADLRVSRAETVRRAVAEMRGNHGQREGAVLRLIDGLFNSFGLDAELELRLDEGFDVEVSVFSGVDGAEASGIYVPTHIREDTMVDLYLGDLSSDARIFVGALPMRSGPSLRLRIADLHPWNGPTVEIDDNESPRLTGRTAAYATGNGRYRRYWERKDGTAFLGTEMEVATEAETWPDADDGEVGEPAAS